jgi:preprotein translocase subunit SecY
MKEEDIMGSAWNGLLGTDYGLFSLIGSIVMLGIGVFFIWFFNRKIQQSSDEHARELRKAGSKPPASNGHA